MLVLDDDTLNAIVIGEATTEQEAFRFLQKWRFDWVPDVDDLPPIVAVTVRTEIRFDPNLHSRTDVDRIAAEGAYAPVFEK